jgi:DNA-binding GntR family transcriptional regulator
MSMTVPSRTRVDTLSAQIRKDILAGRQAPGSKLGLANLVEQYSASMGVIREALSRLVAQGLVEVQPQQGFRVVPVSMADLHDLTEARCHIEALVFRESLEHGSVEWEANVIASHHRLSRLPSVDPEHGDRLTEDWVHAHRSFHSALLEACPNARLRSIAASLRDSAELYRQWSVPPGQSENRDVPSEHAEILRAILDHDVPRAVGLLVDHIRHTTRVLLKQAEDGKSAEPPGQAGSITVLGEA